LQFVSIAKLPGPACPVNAVEAVLPGHRRATLSPVCVHRSNVAHVGSYTGDGCQQQMILAAASQVQRESPLGKSAEEQRSALSHGVKQGRKFPARHTPKKNLQNLSVRGRPERIRPLNALAIDFDA